MFYVLRSLTLCVPLGRYLGVPLSVHWTTAVMLAYLAVPSSGGTAAESLSEAGLFAAILSFVTLHEYGHAWACRRYGVRPEFVCLLPIGGVMKADTRALTARQSIVVSWAGPAVNLALAAGFTAAACLPVVWPEFPGAEPDAPSVPARAAAINFVLAAFNLLPVFPMDGGRIFRGLLELNGLSHYRATVWTLRVGVPICLLLVLVFVATGLTTAAVVLAFASLLGLAEGTVAARSEIDDRFRRRLERLRDLSRKANEDVDALLTARRRALAAAPLEDHAELVRKTNEEVEAILYRLERDSDAVTAEDR